MGRGWRSDELTGSTDYTFIALYKLSDDGLLRRYEKSGYSTLTDPALAFAGAVSQACEAALEAEVKA